MNKKNLKLFYAQEFKTITEAKKFKASGLPITERGERYLEREAKKEARKARKTKAGKSLQKRLIDFKGMRLMRELGESRASANEAQSRIPDIISINYGVGRYAGSYSRYEVSDCRSCIIFNPKMDTRKIKSVQGVGTYIGERIRTNIYEAAWWERGRGKNYNTIKGYLVSDQHIKATTVREAIAKYRIELNKRQRALTRTNGADAAKWLTLEDSKAAGNCEAGTIAFLPCGYGVCAIHSDLAVKLSSKNNLDRVLATISAAKHRAAFRLANHA